MTAPVFLLINDREILQNSGGINNYYLLLGFVDDHIFLCYNKIHEN